MRQSTKLEKEAFQEVDITLPPLLEEYTSEESEEEGLDGSRSVSQKEAKRQKTRVHKTMFAR